jgi:hypothetical protein
LIRPKQDLFIGASVAVVLGLRYRVRTVGRDQEAACTAPRVTGERAPGGALCDSVGMIRQPCLRLSFQQVLAGLNCDGARLHHLGKFALQIDVQQPLSSLAPVTRTWSVG